MLGDETSFWLAQTLYDLGGVEFGSFTLGRTVVNSPVYINPRLLINEPSTLRRLAKLIENEIKAGQARRRPRFSPFSLVAGVPFGGLHLATAFSLASDVPMIYPRPLSSTGPKRHTIEGIFHPGQSVLLIDDLVTGGGSLVETVDLLEDAGLIVRDIIVLVDRQQGATERLHVRGINLVSLLCLKTMLNYYHETGLIEGAWYDRSMSYLDSPEALTPSREPSSDLALDSQALSELFSDEGHIVEVESSEEKGENGADQSERFPRPNGKPNGNGQGPTTPSEREG